VTGFQWFQAIGITFGVVLPERNQRCPRRSKLVLHAFRTDWVCLSKGTLRRLAAPSVCSGPRL
jgi:hypothetical protein